MPYNNFLSKKFNISLPTWSVILPLMAGLLLICQAALPSSNIIDLILGVALITAVLSAVHHAEVIAHKVGEPFGTLILALAITIIEVSLIVSLMLSDTNEGPSALARDTVFAAVMIILTGIIGLCLLIGGFRFKEQIFVKQGVNASLITLIAISVLTMVLPNFTTSGVGNQYSNSQLIFVAIVTLVLYGGFIAVQTFRHRDYFLPEKTDHGNHQNMQMIYEDESDLHIDHATPPNLKTVIISSIMLFVALVAVVLLSKKLSPAIEDIVVSLGAPKSLVGIIIAAVILLPEGLAAIKAVRQDRLQTSLNLALGSALASIGLTIPAVAIVCFMTDMQINLGIDGKSTILLLISLFIISISFNTNKTNIQQGIVLLVIFATYLFTTIVP